MCYSVEVVFEVKMTVEMLVGVVKLSQQVCQVTPVGDVNYEERIQCCELAV